MRPPTSPASCGEPRLTSQQHPFPSQAHASSSICKLGRVRVEKLGLCLPLARAHGKSQSFLPAIPLSQRTAGFLSQLGGSSRRNIWLRSLSCLLLLHTSTSLQRPYWGEQEGKPARGSLHCLNRTTLLHCSKHRSNVSLFPTKIQRTNKADEEMQSHLSIAVQLQHFWHLGEGYVQGCRSPSLRFELPWCRGGLPAWRGQGESSECFLGLYDMLSREASPASLADEALA